MYILLILYRCVLIWRTFIELFCIVRCFYMHFWQKGFHRNLWWYRLILWNVHKTYLLKYNDKKETNILADVIFIIQKFCKKLYVLYFQFIHNAVSYTHLCGPVDCQFPLFWKVIMEKVRELESDLRLSRSSVFPVLKVRWRSYVLLFHC